MMTDPRPLPEDAEFPTPEMIDAYDARNHPAQLVRRVHQRAAQLFTQTVVSPNLSVTQFVSLVTLLKSGPITLGQLSRLTSMDPATTTVVVRNLEKDGMISKSRSVTDQRASVIALTETGRQCALLHIPVSLQAGQALLAPLTPGEKRMFLDLLRKVISPEDTSADP